MKVHRHPGSPRDSVPALSVVLMVDLQRARCERALQSLLTQQTAHDIEIVLLSFGEPGAAPLHGAEDSRVRLIPCRRNLGFGAALALGVRETRAPVVAFLEEHAVTEAGWADALIEAHHGPWAAVGPEVACDNPESETSRMIDLVSFGPWSAPATRCEPPSLRWQNVSYKRSVLLKCEDSLGLYLNGEGALFERLRADGFRLLLEPKARIRHSNETCFRAFLRGNFLSNRLSSASRARLLRMSPLGRTARVANAGLAPLRLTLRLKRSVERSGRPELLRQWQTAFPRVLLYYAVLAAAVQTGLVLGPGTSAVRFLDYELNQRRGIAGLEEVDNGAGPDRSAVG